MSSLKSKESTVMKSILWDERLSQSEKALLLRKLSGFFFKIN